MPLFVCDNCGIVDNTALTNYEAVLNRYWEAPALYDDDPAAYPPPSETLRYLCSACDPESPTHGQWHGQFPARNLSESGYVMFKNNPGYCGKPEWETFFCSHCVMLQGGTPHKPDCCLAGIPAWTLHNHPSLMSWQEQWFREHPLFSHASATVNGCSEVNPGRPPRVRFYKVVPR